MTTATVALSKTEFTDRLMPILADTVRGDAAYVTVPLYNLIYATETPEPGEIFHSVHQLLWMHFSGGGATALATERLLNSIGLGAEIPTDWRKSI